MKVSINWLKDYINIKQSPEKIADVLTMGIAEVEEVVNLSDKFKGIVVGKVLSKEKHPNADRLSLARVNIGSEKLDIVCGASNLEKGQKVPVAIVGAVLPGSMKIEKAKICGEESRGMICSEKELGLAKESEGIMVLDKNAKVGQKFSDYLGLDDNVLDIDNKSLTHRADLFSHIGLAHELSAMLNLKLNLPKLKKIKPEKDYKINVEVRDKNLCPRYMAVALDNIKIGESPKWMRAKLSACGMRPINNIVDITNYVMLEYGQPLHVFDSEKISNIKTQNSKLQLKTQNSKLQLKTQNFKSIIVRKAKKDESIITIDNKKRNLDSKMMVIADSKKPIAIAGVMGGFNSEVDDRTDSIILESANFDKTSVRKTAQRLALHTDAVLRFEKGQSLDLPELGMLRTVELLEKYAGARVSSNVIDTLKRKLIPTKLKLDLGYVKRLVGINIPKQRIIKILKSLDFKVNHIQNKSTLTVLSRKRRLISLKKSNTSKNDLYAAQGKKEELEIEVPIFRTDIAAPEDLVEEIARIYGYGNIKPQEITGVLKPVEEIPDLFWGRKISEYLEGAGFSESYNYSFYGEKLLKKCLLTPKDHLIVENAYSSDLRYLRTTLLPRLLENASLNFRNYEKFKIFEIGHVYFEAATGSVGGPMECKSLSGIIVGNDNDVFYEAKGAIEFLLEKLNIEYKIEALEKTETCEYWNMYEEGASIQILPAGRSLVADAPKLWRRSGEGGSGKDMIGTCSMCDQRVVNNFDIKNKKVAFFSLSLDHLSNKAALEKTYKPLPKFPPVTLDLAFVLNNNISVKQVEDLIFKIGKPLLKNAELFDIYEGKNLEEGKKSLAFHLTYRSDEKTLKDREVEEIQSKIVKKLEGELGAGIRC